jgi:Transposase
VRSSARAGFLPLAPGSPGGTTWQASSPGTGRDEGRVEEVTGGPLYRDRVCGIDIGEAQMVATIRVPSDKDPARRAQETRSFGATKKEVLALAGWLRCWQVPAAVMESTGDYWKGPSCRLEAEGFECVLADARQVKNLPGRPRRDPSDSRWLAACFERGAVTAVFRGHPGVPPDPAAHPVPAGPDRGTGPGEAAGGEAAGIIGDQALQRDHRPARGDRPGHHGPPDRRGA